MWHGTRWDIRGYMDEIRCMPLRKLTDGPVFGQPQGTLVGSVNAPGLTNMMLRRYTDKEGFYAEARGGLEELKPSGGTGADAITSGGHTDILQTSTSYGWVRGNDESAGVFSQNLQLHPGGYKCFSFTAAMAVNDAMYWGADSPFSGIGLSLSQALASATFAAVYEYWNGSAWSALTTSTTITFTALRTPQAAYWTIPTDWAASTVGDAATGRVLKYWMRIRVTTLTVLTAEPLLGRAQGFWNGMREVYVATQNPRAGSANGGLWRQGQNSTTLEWFGVTNSLYSATASPARMCEYRGRVILVNGKDVKRWDGFNIADLGITANAFTVNGANVIGGAMPAGVWRYYAALGDGPCQNISAYADRQDAQPLFGYGRAYPLTTAAGNGEVTTILNDRVQIEIPGGVVGNSSCVAIYRTDDLTNVPAADRANYPAYMIQSFRVQSNIAPTTYETVGIAAAYYYDNSLSYVFPLQEAKAYDVAPPGTGTSNSKPKFLAVYQNRLFLADDETIYWSDPFTPDVFSTKTTTGYIRLARATGGRHMGIVEFADQIVAFTEDQTWGISNVDLDVPVLYPIHPGVGCIAPDSIAVGDGILIWAARDGFYAWDGTREPPRKISGEMESTFGVMSFENHGGTLATIHNRMYDVRRVTPDMATATLMYRYEMDTKTWSRLNYAGQQSVIYPLGSIHAPLGNNDAGILHPVWGKADYLTSGDFTLYLGELTTQDNGTNYDCSARMHFPLEPGALFSPNRLTCYYQAANGWGTPTLGYGTTDSIGSSPGTITAGTPDTGDDYSVVRGPFSAASRGTSNLKADFSVTSAAGGTVQGQRFFGGVLEGQFKRAKRGA